MFHTDPQLVETVNLGHNLRAIGTGNTELYLLTDERQLLAFDLYMLAVTAVRSKPESLDGTINAHNNHLIMVGSTGLYHFDVHTTNATLFLPITADRHTTQ